MNSMLLTLAFASPFQQPLGKLEVPAERYPWFARGLDVAGDVDGDGVSDVFVTGSGRGISYVVSGARDELLLRLERDVNPVGSLTIRRAGDVDGDGRPDLAVRGWYESEFSIHSSRTGERMRSIGGTLLLDVDDVDGKQVSGVCALSTNATRMLRGRESDPLWSAPIEGPSDALSLESAGDLDADGTAEVLVVAGGHVVLRSGRTGKVQFERGPIDGLAPARAIVTGDLDADGKPDLLVAYPDPMFMGTRPRVRAFSSATKAELFTLAPKDVRAEGEVFGGDLASLGDIDDDGVCDFAIASSGGLGSQVVFVSGRTKQCLRRLDPDDADDCPRVYVLRSLPDRDGHGVRDLLLGVSPRPMAGSCDGVVEVRSGKTGGLLRRFGEREVLQWKRRSSETGR